MPSKVIVENKSMMISREKWSDASEPDLGNDEGTVWGITESVVYANIAVFRGDWQLRKSRT